MNGYATVETRKTADSNTLNSCRIGPEAARRAADRIVLKSHVDVSEAAVG